MAADPQSLRRRAVYASLAGQLDEASIMQVLGQLAQSLRSDQASDVIRFVDTLSGPFGLDTAQCKRLYADIYRRLREPEANLPPDPLPAAAPRFAPPPVYPAPAPAYVPQSAFGAAPPGYMPAPPGYMPAPGAYVPQAYAAQPELQATVNPVAAALAAANAAMPQVQSAVPIAAAPAEPINLGNLPVDPPVVFGAVLRRVVNEVAEFHPDALDELRKDSLKQLEVSRAPQHAREAFREAWSRARQHNWQIRASHTDLAELVRVTYLALVEAFGRAGADQILQRALQLAENLPEARQFSPRRLLAAM